MAPDFLEQIGYKPIFDPAVAARRLAEFDDGKDRLLLSMLSSCHHFADGHAAADPAGLESVEALPNDLFDAEQAAAIVEACNADPHAFLVSCDASPSPTQEIMKALERGNERALFITDAGMPDRLEALGRSMPNFRAVVDIFRAAAALSQATDTPFEMAPILLLGSPGVGKTMFSRKLAASLGTPFAPVAVNHLTDVNDLCGRSLSWRAPRMGIVARTLIEAPTLSPLIFLDEIDKGETQSASRHGVSLFDILHSLWEPENARHFADEFLGIRMRADRIIWIATANSVEAMPASLLDRCLMVEIPPLDPEQRIAAVRVMAEAIMRPMAWNRLEIEDEAVIRIAGLSLRSARRLLLLAMGAAALRGSVVVTPGDVDAATMLMPGHTEHRRIGFLR